MALMFPRLARNFIKNGYFPTDDDTIKHVLSAIKAPRDGVIRVLDPCCGEGAALLEVATHLRAAGAEVSAYGVEYDRERAWHAKTVLDRVIHGDLMDTMIQPRSFGVLWLNPPYGDLVSDQAGASAARWKGRKRLEKLFYDRTVGTLQFGGILVLIVPDYSLDAEFRSWIARHFREVRAYRAATDQFRQVVVFGIRKPVSEGVDPRDKQILAAVSAEAEVQDLPMWDEPVYQTLPTVPNGDRQPPRFITVKIDSLQLADEVKSGQSLWNRFEITFRAARGQHRRPLRTLSRWHLALALAAGQVSGAVRSNDGRVYVVKGDTHKEKVVKVENEVDERSGDVRETRIHLDRFVPVIRAIDFTPGSDTFGDVLVIR